MLVIRENAEGIFTEALKQLLEEHEGKRCLHLNIASFVHDDPHAKPQDILEFLANLVHDPDARTFICYDGDILVLARGLTSEWYEAMTTRLQTLWNIARASDHITLYETTLHAKILLNLARIKLEAGLKAQAAAKAEAIEKAEKHAAMIREKTLSVSLDESKIASLSSRRASRSGLQQILLVEDDAFSARMVQKILNKQGDIHVAEDGKSALLAYVKHAPDMVFMDINLPDVSGHDLVAKIKAIDPSAFIVMLSGNSDKHNIMQAMQNGAKGFVGKPFTLDKLLAYVAKCKRIPA